MISIYRAIDCTGSSPQYILILSLIVVTLYCINTLYLRQSLSPLSTEYILFWSIVCVVWVVVTMNFLLGISLRSVQQRELDLLCTQNFESLFLNNLGGYCFPSTQLQSIFI